MRSSHVPYRSWSQEDVSWANEEVLVEFFSKGRRMRRWRRDDLGLWLGVFWCFRNYASVFRVQQTRYCFILDQSELPSSNFDSVNISNRTPSSVASPALIFFLMGIKGLIQIENDFLSTHSLSGVKHASSSFV